MLILVLTITNQAIKKNNTNHYGIKILSMGISYTIRARAEGEHIKKIQKLEAKDLVSKINKIG